MDNPTNWAGNYHYTAARRHHPQNLEQLQELVRRSDKVKVVGTRHSFNAIADTPGDHISLDQFDQTITLDRPRSRVTVPAAVRYGRLCQYLHQEGYALPNLASLPHISVAGACATATHGSGDKNGNLATAVAAMELVTANGELIVLSREQQGEHFDGMVVHLGGLGIVTKLTLNVVPAFDMTQAVYENLPFAQLEEQFDHLFASGYSISLFTDWQRDHFNQLWLKRQATAGATSPLEPNWFGATLSTGRRHPLAGMPVENCTEQLGISGPWYERLPHFRLEFTPSSGEELQSEYFIPRQHAPDAIRAVSELRQQLAPILQISEIRTIAADNLWLSPCYHRPSVAIHFTWRQDWPAVRNFLPLLEAQLTPFHARPHWGKLFTMPPSHLQSLYEKLPAFQELLHHYDPQGKFRNPFLDTYIFGTA